MNHKYIIFNYELRIFLIIKFKHMNHSFHSFFFFLKEILTLFIVNQKKSLISLMNAMETVTL